MIQVSEVDRVRQKLITIGMDPSVPLAYTPGSEHHHPNMSMIGGHGIRLYIYRERGIGMAVGIYTIISHSYTKYKSQ